MKLSQQRQALACAVEAARAAGLLMNQNRRLPKKINEQTQHDIKLELDVHCQKLIEKKLSQQFPDAAILGEEGEGEDQDRDYRWVIDPIDGTVNFAHDIPHACVSIALQARAGEGAPHPDLNYQSIVGVVYDPFCDELWTAIRGQPARLNRNIIQVSQRAKLNESIISLGFAKSPVSMAKMLPVMNRVIPKVRKIRIMGAAALALTYVASGRLDAYLEYGLRLWDIAAGGLIVECAGGEFWHEPVRGDHAFRILANNGLLRRSIERLEAQV